EAGHADLRRNALHFLLHARFDVRGGDGQHEGALEPLILSLDSLDAHVPFLNSSAFEAARRPCSAASSNLPATWTWCARRESNPHIFRYWNLNPARLPVPPRARPKIVARNLVQRGQVEHRPAPIARIR